MTASRAGIVVSGMGLSTGFGLGTGCFWRAVLDGRCALSVRDGRVGASVPLEPVPRAGSRRAALAQAAVAEALDDAGLAELPAGSLVVVAGQGPPMPEAQDDASWCDFVGARPATLPGVPDSAEVLHVSHACATAGFGLAVARDWLAGRLAPAVLVVGACAANAYEHASMDVVRALSGTGVRPFSPDRDGTAIGEGAGALVLETPAAAAARGVPARPVIAGVGYRVGGEGKAGTDVDRAVGVMTDALDEAGDPPVDHVQAHATGTTQGDEAELRALAEVAARREWADVPVSSTKGAIGHLLHTSVLPGVVAAVRVLAERTAPGTVGLAHADRHGPLRLTAGREPLRQARSVLVNGFGFGGNNVSIVLRAQGERS